MGLFLKFNVVVLLAFVCRYVLWIGLAAAYHLPSFKSIGLDMHLSVFFTIFCSSLFFLIIFHVVFIGLWYIGIVAEVAGKRPEIQTIIQNCTVSCSFCTSL